MKSTDKHVDTAWSSISPSALLKKLDTHSKKGITQKEFKKRLKQYGPNKFEKKEHFRFIKLIAEQLSSPLVLILIVAGVITYLLGEITDTVVIGIAVFINTAVGVYQEGRAGKAFERLKSSVKKHAVVIRDGKQFEVDAELLVPGDIVVLQSGDQVPADLRLLDVKGLEINEAVLTGEWLPVSKNIDTVPPDTRITEQKNMAFMGTLVEDGLGHGVVVGTGFRTELGKIASLLDTEEKELTPFQVGVKKLARIITYVIVAIIIVIFFLGILEGEAIGEMFITSVAIAVAAIPEGLPVAVTVILAIGMTQTLRKGGLIKKLVKAETLGSTTVILTDKTGTLTKGEMNFAGVASANNIISRSSSKKSLKDMRDDITEEQKFVIKTGIFTSNAFIENEDKPVHEWVVKGNPTDRALILAGVHEKMLLRNLTTEEPVLDELPFSSERRFAASLHKTKEGNRIYITGALEFILSHADKYLDSSGRKIKFSDTRAVKKFYENSTREGMRIVATAYSDTSRNDIPRKDQKEFLSGLVFTGLIGFHDPVRPDVIEAIAETKRAGLRPIMVTGDHANTALSVAKEIGFEKTDVAITGEMLESMNTVQMQRALKSHQVFARVLPSQKMKLVDSLSKAGEIVAMTGDGVNDAPALKKADIGIAVGSGTAVAKEAADLVLLKDSFSIVVAAVEGGRVIVDNLRKVVTYLLGANFSGVTIITAALLMQLPLPVLPVQILWANIVEEGFMNFALAFEPKESDVMRRTKKQLEPQKIINREMKVLIFGIGIFTSLILTLLYIYLYKAGYHIDHIRTIIFAGLSIDALFFVFSIKSLRKPIWKINIFSNYYLLGAYVLSSSLLVAALTFPPLQSLLKTVTPSFSEVLIILGLGIVDLMLIEAGKWYFISRKLA